MNRIVCFAQKKGKERIKRDFDPRCQNVARERKEKPRRNESKEKIYLDKFGLYVIPYRKYVIELWEVESIHKLSSDVH